MGSLPSLWCRNILARPGSIGARAVAVAAVVAPVVEAAPLLAINRGEASAARWTSASASAPSSMRRGRKPGSTISIDDSKTAALQFSRQGSRARLQPGPCLCGLPPTWIAHFLLRGVVKCFRIDRVRRVVGGDG